MKINLLYDSNDLLSGYVNVDPFKFNQEGVTCCDLENLEFCSVGEAEEVICTDILSHFQFDTAIKTLFHYISKLGHGGKITVTDVNAYEVSRQFTMGKINLKQFNDFIFGPKYPLQCTIGLTDVIQVFQQAGLKINLKRLDGFKFTIVGERP